MKPHMPLRYVLGFSALLAAYSAQAAPQVWDNGGVTGNWNTTDLNWDAGSIWTNNNDAQFTGSGVGPITITEVGGVSAASLSFTANGYSVGGAEDLTLTGPAGVAVSSGFAATIGANIAGSAGLTKSGGGDLTINGNSTYSGTTTVNDGTLYHAGNLDLANNTSILVDGGTSVLRTLTNTNGITIGSGSSVQSLTVQGGGQLLDFTSITLGATATSNGNSITFDGAGTLAQVIINSSGNKNLRVGAAGDSNILTVSGGATFNFQKGNGTNAQIIGDQAGADNNSMVITGTGSSYLTTAPLTVGNAGSGNSLQVLAGGSSTSQRLAVGSGGGAGNSVLVDGVGSLVYVAPSSNGVFTVGGTTSGNSLTVQNGGSANLNSTRDNRLFAIGGSEGSDNNVVTATGSGSSLNLSHTKLAISLGGTVIGATNAVTDSTGSGNRLDVLSGASATLTPVFLLGTSSAINLGDGTGISTITMGANEASTASTISAGISLTKSDSRLYIDSGRLVTAVDGNLVSGSGEVVLSGAAYISTTSVAGSNVTTVISGGGSLTKEDTGLLVLSGANSYTGDTTVTGTLSLQSAYLADASTISVFGVLDLDTAGATDDVGALYLGGVLQTLPGTYGSLASAADYKSDTYFSGTGMLQLVPEPGVALLGGLGLLTLLRRRRNA
ncbi:MAG: autotransporter-associated beta strand repeat-containing protein [Verrucomicrobia bacterium]|nr:autotransporter-associated beta strand repeat-containing protein [Verrucomicrobiota bacterium]